MAAPVSGFKTQAARDAYYRLYDEAIGLSAVPVEESDIETSFGTTHVLTAGDPSTTKSTCEVAHYDDLQHSASPDRNQH